MRKTALIMAFLLPCFVYAQKGVAIIPYIPALEIKPEPAEYTGHLPFDKIQIIDSRFDTTKLGYTKKGGAHAKLIVSGGLKKALEATLNSSLQTSLDSSSNENLLIVIKHLWLRETTQNERGKNNIVKEEAIESFTECKAKLELYLQKDNFYIPLIRIDSTFDYWNQLNRKGGSILMVPFEKSLSALEKIDWDKVKTSGKKLTKSEVADYNNKRFTVPILQPFAPKTGIYLTFQDFVQNKIMPCSFTVERESVVDHVYITKDDEKVLITEFWGACDGQKLFIKAGFRLYELIRQNNTFDFYGNLSAISNALQNSFSFTSPGGTPVTIQTNHSRKRLLDKHFKPYQLNMETGTVY